MLFRAPIILNSLITHEVKSATGVDTLFRSNSIGTKAIELYMNFSDLSNVYRFMKLTAHGYLEAVILPSVLTIYKEKRVFSTDNKDGDSGKGWKAAQEFIEHLLNTIYNSADKLPRYLPVNLVTNSDSSLHLIFCHIGEVVAKTFPDEVDAQYVGVSGFLFLRFISAALMGPKLFDLTDSTILNPFNSSLTFRTSRRHRAAKSDVSIENDNKDRKYGRTSYWRSDGDIDEFTRRYKPEHCRG